MGNSNNVFEVVESKCNLKHREPKMDSGVITDKTKLPILSVSYGRIIDGMARISIGPLECSSSG